MMISNCDKKIGLYKSKLKNFLIEKYNYDNTKLIYANKYKESSFSITRPNSNYKNCSFINGYPHFEIPVDVCLDEIESFIYGDVLYDDNFTIRYGDIHPNKPVPMLGQLRNIIIDEIYSNMIRTSGTVTNVFSIGDISFKTIKYFLENSSYGMSRENFEFMIDAVFNISNHNDLMYNDYQKFCIEQIKVTDDVLKKIATSDLHYLFESQLYKDKELYNNLKELYCEDGLKENGIIKYVLQEFMFLLNKKYNKTKIINIIGSDQSEHIKKVFDVINDNNLSSEISFLTYGICKNAGSRNIDEWKNDIDTQIKKSQIKISEALINWNDFLKFSGVVTNPDNILDFENLKWFNSKPIKEIFDSIKDTKSIVNIDNSNIFASPLLHKMTLVNQVFDEAIVSGNPSKVIRYLYDVAKEYNSDKKGYEQMQNIYYRFVTKTLEYLTLDKTETFQKILKRSDN